jgi:hypothetical protein
LNQFEGLNIGIRAAWRRLQTLALKHAGNISRRQLSLRSAGRTAIEVFGRQKLEGRLYAPALEGVIAAGDFLERDGVDASQKKQS